MLTRRILFVFSLILSSLLVACGTNANGTGDAQSLTLTQNLSFQDQLGGTTSLSYPEGWISNTENGSIAVATSAELLENVNSAEAPSLDSGEVLVTTFVVPAEMSSFLVPSGEEPSAVAIANSFISDLGENDTMGEIEETTINEHPAAVVTGNAEGLDVVLVALDLGEGVYAIIFGGTAQGEAASIRPTIEAMAASLSYELADSE